MPNYQAYVVEEIQEKRFVGDLKTLTTEDLPSGEVLVRVRYSSLNYKDALSASGNRGVTRAYPHTPGIDAAGEVVESRSATFAVGEEVIVTGYDLGMNTAGGFGQFIRVPANWCVRKPGTLSLREAMILGTAGFTAALCVEKLILNGLKSDQGEVVVSGASGGVGSIAVALLAHLGFQVVASTGKPNHSDWFQQLGASEVLSREVLSQEDSKPLQKPRWAGAVDTVGGVTLSNLIKTLAYGGSVAACGMVQSAGFESSVFPFILRGVNLLGVDSVELPQSSKQAVWDKLGKQWKLECLESLCTEIGFDALGESLQKLLQGQSQGRILLNTENR